MPEEPMGLAELREVLQRLAGRANLPYDEADIAAIADNLYHHDPAHAYPNHPDYNPALDPTSDDYDAGLDPQQWAALAALEDYRIDPYGPSGQWIPKTVFGHKIRNDEDLSPLPENLKALRDEQWTGWQGPGWIESELPRDRPRETAELSPGDLRHHQWMRDHDYLQAILSRKRNPIEGMKPEVRQGIEAWTGPQETQSTPEEIEQRNLQDALHYYRKGQGATHYFGKGDPDAFNPLRGMVPGMDWGTANFKEYGTDEGIAASMSNNDYVFGNLVNNAFLPGEEALNRATMQHMEERDYGLLGEIPVIGQAGRAVSDFFRNSLRSDTVDGSDYARQRQIAKQMYTGSPLIPSSNPNPSREERIAKIQDVRKALRDSENMSGDDYYFSQTDKNPSYLGKQLMTFGSSMIGDPSVYLTAGLGGLRSLGNFWKGFKGELLQEAAENAGFTGVSSVFPLGEGLSTPHIKDWMDPGKRTDIPKEDPTDRIRRIREEEKRRQEAIEFLKQSNAQLPPPYSGAEPPKSPVAP